MENRASLQRRLLAALETTATKEFITVSIRKYKEAWSTVHKRGPGYVVTILINLAMIYLFQYLRDHRPFFLSESYGTVLPVITISLCASILAQIAFLVYDR